MALDDTKSVADLAAEIKADHAKSVDAVKEIAEKALAEAEKGTESARSFKENADAALTKMNELSEQVTSMEQKLARASAFEREAERAKSLGQQFIEADDVKAALEKGTDFRGKVQFGTKATITSATTAAAGSAGAAVDETRPPRS